MRLIKAYPNVYLWTSYPLACVQRLLYKQTMRYRRTRGHADEDQDHYGVDVAGTGTARCYHLELVTMLERLANYGQTGNVRVITRRLMDMFHMSTVILRGSLPYLGGHILLDVHSNVPTIEITLEDWPCDEKTTFPLISSFAALRYYYGKDYSDVSTFH